MEGLRGRGKGKGGRRKVDKVGKVGKVGEFGLT